MRRIASTLLIGLLFMLASRASEELAPIFETNDINRFWAAYDSLHQAKSFEDSVSFLQNIYLNQATDQFNLFIEKRNFTAHEYVLNIRQHPKFWESIRPLTENIASREAEIREVLEEFEHEIPGFKQPDVCFAIGCMRTGGTTSKGLILIGAEIAAADSTVDKSELSPWLQSVIGRTGDITSMVAHEAIHTAQRGFPLADVFAMAKHRKLSLLNASIMEGSCDFYTDLLLGRNINASIHSFGDLHACELYHSFLEDCKQSPYDYKHWMYAGNNTPAEYPADLGYYIGYKIAQAYYENDWKKKRALRKMLRLGKYRSILRKSELADWMCPDHAVQLNETTDPNHHQPGGF